MDLELNDEHQLLKQAMREFAEGEIAPALAVKSGICPASFLISAAMRSRQTR